MDQYTHDVNDDFLILVAAGNAGSDSGSIGTPATAKNILSVGAGGNTASAYSEYGVPQSYRYLSGQVVDFSSRGPTADGRIKPDVVCPGHYIMSASSDGDTSTNQVRTMHARPPTRHVDATIRLHLVRASIVSVRVASHSKTLSIYARA
jgi:hypothetical protein